MQYHYEGINNQFEDEPIDILRFTGLTIYSVVFPKHKDFYHFFNSEEVIDDFLRNVKYKLKPGGKKLVKCSFTNRKHSAIILSRFKASYQ